MALFTIALLSMISTIQLGFAHKERTANNLAWAVDFSVAMTSLRNCKWVCQLLPSLGYYGCDCNNLVYKNNINDPSFIQSF